MPNSPTNAIALRKIAGLAGSNEPAQDRLTQILGVTRETLGLSALSVVAGSSGRRAVSSWHSSADGYEIDPKLIETEALDALANGGQLKSLSPGFVVPIPSLSDYQMAVVGMGSDGSQADSALIEMVSGFISILVENHRLAQSLESSNRLAHQRIQEIATIYEIGQAMEATDGRKLLDLIVAKAAAVMEAQTCSLMLRHDASGALVIEASYGLSDDVVRGARINYGQGIAGTVAQTGEPMLIVDVAADPRLRGSVGARPGISASMCVPLKDEDGAIHGVLSIRRHEPNPPFNEDDLKVFSVFATHAALAISNAQLYSRLNRKVQEMSAISEVLRAINSTLDLEHVLDQIVTGITEVVGFDRCCVYLLDSRSNEFVAGARKGYREGDKIVDRASVTEGVIGLAAEEKISIFSLVSPVDPEGVEPCGEFLVAPIVVRDSCTGVVVVDNCETGRAIQPEHVELLSTFVSQAGIAVENARLYEAMEEKYSELNVLYEHSRSISAAYGVANAAEVLATNASRAVRCDGAGLLLLDPRRGHLSLQAVSGAMGDDDDIRRAAELESSVEFVRRLGSPVLLSATSPERTGGAESDFLNALAPGGSNLLLAPLIAEETTIGALALYRRPSDEFQGAEFKLISIITSQAAAVLKNAISYEQKMRQKVLEMTALYEFSKKISSAANLEEALDSILVIVADLVDYDESFIYAIDHDNAIAMVRAARFRGEARGLPPDEPLDGSSVTSWAISERMALVSPDITRDQRFSKSTSRSADVRSLMSIPLVVQDGVVGVLSVHSHSPNQYSEDDVRVLSIIASQGAAIYKELEALTALANYTDNILSSIAAGVITLGSDGSVLTWNKAAEKIMKRNAEDAVGLHYESVLKSMTVCDSDKKGLRRAIESVLTTGETYQGYKLPFHPSNMDDVHMNVSISQLLNSSNEQLGLVIIFEDVTREIKMENDFRRMGELAAVGQLAASIAHELRNPLSSIKGAAQFLQKEYEDQGPLAEFLGIIVDEVNGLNGLTTEFLEFARPMELELKPISVNTVVEKTMQLMSVHITDNNVVVKQNLADPVNEVQADSKQIEQVLKNVIINSLQAMPEGGTITIETGSTASGGAYLSVSDTGSGIASDKLEKIFQPFFTTKTKGTGLGLSVVHKIIDNHGGRIEVTSEPDAGSTFKILLPKAGAHAQFSEEIDQATVRRTSGELRGGEAI